jgi:hypothetical protein
VDRTDIGSYPVACFAVKEVGHSVSTTRELVRIVQDQSGIPLIKLFDNPSVLQEQSQEQLHV